MSEPNSTRTTPACKPRKPYPEYPLTPHHGARQWCKKIRGKLHYFGPLVEPQAALDKYLRVKDDLHAGREPKPDPEALGALTVKHLANEYLNHKASVRDVGELQARTWEDYKHVCDLLVARFGRGRLVADLGPTDFAGLRKVLAQNYGPVRLGNMIQTIRSVFRF